MRFADGSVNPVKKPIELDEYEYDEVDDEDFNPIIVKRKIQFEHVTETKEDGETRNIRRKINPTFFAFYENAEGKIEKYPVKMEVIDEISDHGNIRQINHPIEKVFYDYYQLSDSDLLDYNNDYDDSKIKVEKEKLNSKKFMNRLMIKKLLFINEYVIKITNIMKK